MASIIFTVVRESTVQEPLQATVELPLETEARNNGLVAHFPTDEQCVELLKSVGFKTITANQVYWEYEGRYTLYLSVIAHPSIADGTLCAIAMANIPLVHSENNL